MNFLKKNINKIICSDSIIGLSKIEDNTIDMVVTSPPYDQLRDYDKKEFDLDGTGEEIFRVLKEGSICAVVLQDQTKNFAKSLTTFKTAVNWCDKIGFKLFETVIYRKHGSEGAWWTKRFRVDHEYIHLFLKGDRPSYFNKTPLKIPSKHGGKTMIGSGNRRTDGSTTKTTTLLINKMKCRGTVWDYLNAGDKDKLKRMHPAPFPDKIPYDLINCFCKKGGIVLDPFMGSGSTAVSALKLNRNFIGFDISKAYCDIALKRIKTVQRELIE
jgi:site-specific DNA-methyltransferase (adenine-specific)